jgi:hypothetical protein
MTTTAIRRKPVATPARRETFKVNVDFPLDLLARIDREAARIGVPRQSWIKMRLADVLGREDHPE